MSCKDLILGFSVVSTLAHSNRGAFWGEGKGRGRCVERAKRGVEEGDGGCRGRSKIMERGLSGAVKTGGGDCD
ncbi:unnamed protein product, partial [Musa hybrid cultivar]